ncbi:MAG: hypothetical protein KJ006_07235 [Thermoleophilia bacterium]|nr:hypothetical protein [Thermoleophilia bacterium]
MKATIALVLVAGLAAVAVLPGCGGGDEAGADPRQILDDALGGEGGVDSGVLDIELDVAASGEGAGEMPIDLSAELGGPFQSNGPGELPSVDFELSASVDAGGMPLDLDGGLTLTGDGAWVGFEDAEYQLDDATFRELEAAYEQSAAEREDGPQGSLEQLGIDPRDWVTDLANEGTEDLDGDEVVHVSGTADVPKLVSDLSDVARRTGQATALDDADLDLLAGTVGAATIDVYATSGEHALRQIDVGLKLADPSGGPGELDVALSVGIADPGGEQDISPPEDARPLSELLGRIPGGMPALGIGGAGGVAPPQASGSAEDYYDCVAKAKSSSAIEECIGLLGG